MNPMKMKLIKEIMSHLSDKQGMGIKESLDESKKPKIPDELEIKNIQKDSDMEKDNPVIEIESEHSEDIDPEKSGEEMSDEELEELISKLVKK